MAKLKHIPIDKLQPHPDNPRLFLREHVVENIAAQLKASGVFSERHALSVRPLNGHYQIISGHTRHEAARRADIKVLPCCVEEMSDREAFMQLALANEQSELGSLERAIHIHKAVKPGKGGQVKGGSGIKEGFKDYNRLTGLDPGYLSKMWKAGQTAINLINRVDLSQPYFSDKANHFAIINSAGLLLEELLVKTMQAQQWSAADTQHWVGQVNEFKPVDERWAAWLPLVETVAYFLSGKEFSPKTVSKLIQLGESTEATIRAYEHVIDADSYLASFYAWLEAGRTDRSTWDSRALVGYQRKLMAEFELAEMDAAKRWNHGNWREFVGDLDDGSISLLLTDPPYGMNFQSDYKLDRREERNHEEIANDAANTALTELGNMLDVFLPKLADNAHVLIFCHWSNEPEFRDVVEIANLQVRGSLVWVKNNTGMGDPSTTFAPQHERIIHAVKGSPVLLQRASDVLAADRVLSFRHPTEKPVSLLSVLIEATTTEGELVADPFAGVASTVIAAKLLKRSYWGCELEEGYFKAGRERLEGGDK